MRGGERQRNDQQQRADAQGCLHHKYHEQQVRPDASAQHANNQSAIARGSDRLETSSTTVSA
jgi:hypothetical protein